MASLERDLAAVDGRQCQQFLHEEVLLCSMTLVSKAQKIMCMQVFTGKLLPCRAGKFDLHAPEQPGQQ